MPEWDAEIHVDAERAAALIGQQFRELRGLPVRELASGWDNVVHLVDERLVFRFPRREIAIPGVEREITTLGRLATHLPLPIPVPVYMGAPAGDYPWPWFGAEHLPGVEIAEADLPDDRREALGSAVGTFLRALHAPATARLLAGGLPIDPMRRTDMRFRVVQARYRFAQLESLGLWRPTDAIERLLADAAELPPPPVVRVLHGDLHMRHVLVTPEGSCGGVIDWGDVCSGDPSADLSIAYGSFEGPARAALLDAYGPVDGLTELRARVIAAFLAAALLAYAADRGMGPLQREALRSLERVVA